MTSSRICHHTFAILLVATTGLSASAITRRPATYRAGIVEFDPPPPSATKRETILKNAKLFGEYAARAAEMGVQILVFPEYGLTSVSGFSGRKGVADYLQDVPDPKLHPWNPCQQPDKFNNTQVLHELSCAASKNSLVIVANLLSKEPCDPANHLSITAPTHQCPKDGHYQFNTNVIFAKNGTLLARYHKRHLFMEESYADPAPEPEYVILDLGFVRIATIVCFDILFAQPTVELVEKHGIRNIAFPTHWVNELPFMTAPQSFSSIAYGLGVNVLAANYFKPRTGSLGSGIFSSTRGVLNGTWDISTPGRLVIADVPVEPSDVVIDDQSLTCELPMNSQVQKGLKASGFIPYVYTDMPSSKPANKTHRIIYEPLEDFVYANITGMQGNIIQLCQDNLCCNLTYTFANRDSKESYKFVARSGVLLTPGGYKLGIQICSVLRCENEGDLETCGRVPDPSHTPNSIFHRFTITGRFDTKYLYPSVFSTKLGLVNTDRWNLSKRDCRDESGNGLNTYTIGKLNITTDIQRPILGATIFGRVYEWDA